MRSILWASVRSLRWRLIPLIQWPLLAWLRRALPILWLRVLWPGPPRRWALRRLGLALALWPLARRTRSRLRGTLRPWVRLLVPRWRAERARRLVVGRVAFHAAPWVQRRILRRARRLIEWLAE